MLRMRASSSKGTLPLQPIGEEPLLFFDAFHFPISPALPLEEAGVDAPAAAALFLPATFSCARNCCNMTSRLKTKTMMFRSALNVV